MNIQNIVEVPLTEIQLQGINVRSDLQTPNSKESIEELAENIRVNGLLQPIVLTGEFGKPVYDVIVGQRRFLAHQLLGLPTIWATFSGPISQTEALLLSLSENMCRQEMNYADIANAITFLYENFGKDVEEVHRRTGFSRRTIRNYLLLDSMATPKIKALLTEGKITRTDAKRAIDAAQGDEQKADALIDEVVRLTKYEKKRLIEFASENPDASASDIVSRAKQPKFEETIILNLPINIHSALKTASDQLAIDVEELTMNAVVAWLKTNDFLQDA